MDQMFITLVGFNNHHGHKVFKIGSIIKLVKEPDNVHDLEAIACEMRHAGKVAYVANSTSTVIKGTMSAGRLYDKITDNKDFAKVKFIGNHSIIAEVLSDDEIDELKKDPASDINFLLADD